ncbi:hypothetical protein VitviT2T_008430 [Vitis vinifera]|uniref:BED-type domain-containing protein n=1 Tax=Vitis vinifera TaxID=29760 RepID=A0ABY9C3C1_VITVI|nr:hypothetical protein VitviT2T_008430 [Vitis vinifera]
MTSEREEIFFMPSSGSNLATGSTSTIDGSLTCKKRKLTSIVWNEFEKVIIDGQDYAICKHCKSKLKADSKNGTKHLHVHLDRCIKRRNVDIKQQFLTIERKGYGKVQIGGFAFDQDISREKLARPIILHEYPLSIVDHADFRDFASSLQPLFKMISRNTIKDDIMKIYEFEKGKMSSYLEKLETRMTITIDMWTSNQKKGYMAITVYYIDESWLLHHHIVRLWGQLWNTLSVWGDEQDGLFVSNMGSSGVNFSALRIKKGPTTQCVCLVDALGNHTMRPCLSSVVKIQADELTKEDFKGVKWLVMRYGIYNLEVIHAVIQMAKEEGIFVSLDLTSFELVRNFRGPLLKLLQSGDIDLCFANEDETRELLRDDENASPEAALEFLAKHCQWAVVALGYNRCLAKCGREVSAM